MRILWQQFTEVAPKALVAETTQLLVAKRAKLVAGSELDVDALKQAAAKFGAGSAEQRFATRILGRLTAERPSTVGSSALLDSVKAAQAQLEQPVQVPAATSPSAAVAATTTSDSAAVWRSVPRPESGLLPMFGWFRWPAGTYAVPVCYIVLETPDGARAADGALTVHVEVSSSGSVSLQLPNADTLHFTEPMGFSDSSSGDGRHHWLCMHTADRGTRVTLSTTALQTSWALYDPPPQ